MCPKWNAKFIIRHIICQILLKIKQVLFTIQLDYHLMQKLLKIFYMVSTYLLVNIYFLPTKLSGS